MLIQTKDLTHVYSRGTPMEQVAIRGINLSIDESEFIGIIGQTGSGKSTLIQHFNALLTPSSGKVFVDGIDTTGHKNQLKAVRQKVGLVFQYPEHQLFEETVQLDIAFGPKNLGLSEAEVQDRVESSLDIVGLSYEDLKDRSPFELSGGQMRRVAIAGVLAMRPKVLVLDEPTAGLDPQGQQEIMAQIESFHRRFQLTVVLVTHSMEYVAKLSKRLFVMNEGEIKLEGTPKTVFSQTGYLKDLGLGVPEVSLLMQRLQAQGWDVPADIFTVKDAKRVLIDVMRRKRDDTNV